MKNAIATVVAVLMSALGFAQDKAVAENELSKLSGQWMTATKSRDVDALNKIVDPEFKLFGSEIDDAGIAREIWLKNTLENLKIESFSYNKINVDVFGDVALVRSNFSWSFAFKEFPSKSDTVNLIDTWIRRKDGWKVVRRVVVGP